MLVKMMMSMMFPHVSGTGCCSSGKNHRRSMRGRSGMNKEQPESMYAANAGKKDLLSLMHNTHTRKTTPMVRTLNKGIALMRGRLFGRFMLSMQLGKALINRGSDGSLHDGSDF